MDPIVVVAPLIFYTAVFSGVALVVGLSVRQHRPLLAIVGAVAIAYAAMGAFLASASTVAWTFVGSFLFAGVVMGAVAFIANALRRWD